MTQNPVSPNTQASYPKNKPEVKQPEAKKPEVKQPEAKKPDAKQAEAVATNGSKTAAPAAPVVWVKPKLSSRFSWRQPLGWIALMAALWGILTHFAIAHITQQIPILAAQPVLTQVEPVMESAFHAIAAWDQLQEHQDNLQDRTLRQQFGHLPYAELAPTELMVIGSYTAPDGQRFERMQEEAALSLLQMIDAARRRGIWLVPISGFRDYQRQDQLFAAQTEYMGTPEAAALTVAPPGYSEHHTGLAVDLADGMARAMDLSLAFGETEAFRWLTRHGSEFGYELSFPEDNDQGVSYEPWHWRFIGSPDAERTFARADWRQPLSPGLGDRR